MQNITSKSLSTVRYFSVENKTLLLICLMITVSRFSLDSYLPSLPAIGNQFDVSQSSTQMTLTTFLIGLASSQFLYGPLSDSYGRKKIILLGFSIFIVGILLCMLSNSITMLMFSRFIAGLGAGVSSSLKRAVASDLFTDYRLAKANATQSNATLITILIAPVIGGYVQQHFGWRANFFIVLIYALIIFMVLQKSLVDTRNNEHLLPFNISALFSNYYTVITYQPFLINMIYSSCAFAGMVVFTQLSAFIFIETYGVTPSHYGWLMMLIAFSYLAAGIVVNRFVQRLGMSTLILIGLLICLSAGILVLALHLFNYSSMLAILIPAMLYVIGSRIVIPNAMARSLSPLASLSGYASSLIGILQTISGATGSYLASLLNYPSPVMLAITYLTLTFTSFIVLLLFDHSPYEVVATD